MIPTEGSSNIEYLPSHAATALDILQRLLPHVTPHIEYTKLMEILAAPARWKEAHAHFSKIRVNITLPSDARKERGLDAYFINVAENAAKTAYNCSHEPAPFDEQSFDCLLAAEGAFLDALAQGTPRR